MISALKAYHKNNISYSGKARSMNKLFDNFTRREIAFKTHSSSGTKFATHLATNLSKQTPKQIQHKHVIPQNNLIKMKQVCVCTCDDMHKVDLGPPGRGSPPYLPKRLSYRIITASTKPPFRKLMRSLVVTWSVEWETECRVEERVLNLERRRG